MDKKLWSDFIAGLLTVFFALILNSFIPAIYAFGFFSLTLGILISGGIGAIITTYVRKYGKF